MRDLMAATSRSMNRGVRIWPLFAFTGTVFGLAALYESMFNVEGGHRAVIFNKLVGTRDNIYTEGTNLKIPFLEDSVIYDTRAKPHNIRSPTGSRDLQMVDITLRILSRPIATELVELHKEIGPEFDTCVLPSIVNEITKAVVARYTASDLLTKREEVSSAIKEELTRRAREFHISLDDVSITHVNFGQEFRAAVESKQVAQQESEQARILVQKATQDKKSAIIKAQGEAETARLIGHAVAQNPNFLKIRRLEALRDIAGILATSNNRIMLNSDILLLHELAQSQWIEAPKKEDKTNL